MATALITGASGAIGSQIVRTLAARGDNVCIGYNNNMAAAQSLAHELAENYGVQTAAVRFDLSDPQSLHGSAGECRETLGRVDILVNNGGCEAFGLFQDMTDEQLISVMNADLIGSMLLTRLLLCDMLKNHSGYIVNVSSVWGEVGASCETAYSAAKAGLIGFTKALAKETAPSGVLVNCVSPGFIDTPMNGRLSDDERLELISGIPCSRAGTPQDVAEAVAFLTSGKADYICGQVLRVDGGWL